VAGFAVPDLRDASELYDFHFTPTFRATLFVQLLLFVLIQAQNPDMLIAHRPHPLLEICW
jgi:hypothetical protein